jgi:GTP pyrophosphokinase
MPATTRNTPDLFNAEPVLQALHTLLREQPAALGALDTAVDVAEVVLELTADPRLAGAALLHGAWSVPDLAELPSPLKAVAGPEMLRQSIALRRLGEFRLDDSWASAQSLNSDQSETLRKMLLAVVGDPRLVVARLALQLVRMRHARDLPEPQRRRLALETRDLYAPLANRLGIWGVKWELEDLALRELQPEDYRRIASSLNEKRADREAYIANVRRQLREALAAQGIEAEVQGRPKHIYSIYRKMQRKRLLFGQLFDVRAVRIIVGTVAECYAALGIVHGLWPIIPSEFDDYIATPKGNNYQSIHTAVAGPDGRPLEVQIRTHDMQAQAELGVAAHWVYKEGGGQDQRYERKIEAVRELLKPGAAAPAAEAAGPDADDPLGRLSQSLFDDRVYAMTPKGEVVDLPRGATPLDFAFHVHSDLGQRCRGAKVDGRIVPLDHPLANGNVVDIIVGKNAAPSRDWLLPSLGYLASPRSRAKLRAYFRRLDEATAPAAEAHEPPQVIEAPTPADTEGLPKLKRRTAPARSPVEIDGVGDLPITLASCCGPVRPQPIEGYLTLGRGVTIHRHGCPSLARMLQSRPERRLQVEWALDSQDTLVVAIDIRAYDRRGLLRDISDVIAEQRMGIEGVNSDTDPRDRIAHFVVRVGIPDSAALDRLMAKLKQIPNVFQVRRSA